ncbi:DUF982 domain-containing protein [Allorhizobium sp. BGMRC 0089]|uniref:DUF982 domain-containing protein n=1 Tax=Allorhizobium sonneratiae TaxID=2934936 RepID=UPI00203338A5|nr:DUF982 domain-containing protein [Allorhizobium sonneratiae]MCM2292132.1 DUF982 domain-containing protein [Allorhizobium sonneratiae]
MINDKTFERPLTFTISGTHHKVASLREAAWLLADCWPDFSCATFRRALAACGAALEGKRSVSYARRALILAAHKAQVAFSS